MLSRLLVRMRWPMAVLSALALVAMLASVWWYIRVLMPIGIGTWGVHLRLAAGGAMIVCEQWDDRTPGLQFPKWDYVCTYYPVWDDWGWCGRFGAEFKDLGGRSTLVTVFAPAWVMFVPPCAIAIAGFLAKRRQPKSGECASCRHPLVCAAVCPECGHRVANASSPGG